ncbi:MAG: helix-turn-helix domain-containing protein [Christensenellales bacterium]
MTIAEALSKRLIQLMEERNMTAYRLSMLSGVNQTTIADIKKMRNTTVNVRIIFELCQGLGIDLSEFFSDPVFSNDNIID